VTRRRLGRVIWKEFIQMRRDRPTLALMLGIPVIQLLVFGYAVRMDVRDLPMAVYDQSRTRMSRELVQKLEATDNFAATGVARSYTEAVRMIDRGEARAAVVIPEDYARRLKRGLPATAQMLVDASDPNTSQNAIAAALLVGQAENITLLVARAGTPARPDHPPFEMRVRPLYNPALKSAIFIVPGIIGVILSITMLIITSISIVREREFGTLEQLIVTPVTRGELMLGKILPYALVGYVQVTAVLLLGRFIFGMPVVGSLALVYAVTFLFIVANLGLGLFISTLVRTQSQAMQASYFFVLPNILLSGFMFPREGMPFLAREIGLAFPLTYFLQILRGILLKGATLRDVLPQTGMLLLLAALFFGFSVTRFRKQLE
jgi:ABC-2 type transport system permease protein